jgi:hypothetical protein
MFKFSITAILLSVFLAACSTSSTKKSNDDSIVENGISRTFKKDGKLFSENTLKNGKKTGASKTYYDNGKIWQEENYENDKRNGLTKQYYEEGTLSKVTNYKEDLLDGISQKFRKDGIQAWEARYERGMPCNGLKEYYTNGKLKTDYSTIVIDVVDDLRNSGVYKLKLHLSDNSKSVKFYKGYLTQTGCFDKSKVEELYPNKDGKAELVYFLSPSEFKMEEIGIIAVVETIQDNYFLATRFYNLSITN